MKTKTCTRCGEIKLITKFCKDKRSPNGYINPCLSCAAANQKSRYNSKKFGAKMRKRNRSNLIKARKRNRQFIKNYLSSRLCVDCGEKRWVVLEFDHIANKKHAISIMVGKGFSIASIEKELSKCEVRCANCHRIKTYKQLGQWRLCDLFS